MADPLQVSESAGQILMRRFRYARANESQMKAWLDICTY